MTAIDRAKPRPMRVCAIVDHADPKIAHATASPPCSGMKLPLISVA
jgi:hypothetical protein